MDVLLIGLLTGLAAVPHCAAMCGPLAAFACSRGVGRGAPLRYQAGRTLSYAAAGGLAGALGGVITAGLSSAWTSAVLSWSLAIALGIAAWRLWSSGSRERRDAIVALHAAKPKRSLFERAIARMPKDPLVLGFLTALLPCGALAAALLVAAGTSSAGGGALVMLGFATTSSFALLGIAWLAHRLRRLATPVSLRALSVALLVGAVLLAVRPVGALAGDDPHACCESMR